MPTSEYVVEGKNQPVIHKKESKAASIFISSRIVYIMLHLIADDHSVLAKSTRFIYLFHILRRQNTLCGTSMLPLAKAKANQDAQKLYAS